VSDALDRIRERTRQLREAQRARMDAAIAAARQRASAREGPHVVGSRVFDTVTGLEGEVAGRTSENVVVPTPAK
jgi:hypothetical protein